MNKNCHCKTCKGIHSIIYAPGTCEAIVKCQACGQLWYSLLYEQMNFASGNDTLEEYQIPITFQEYQYVIETPYHRLNLSFLRDRKARVIHEGGIVEIDSNFALGRCGLMVNKKNTNDTNDAE